MKKCALLMFFLLTTASIAIAHDEGENDVGGYQLTFVTIPELPVAGELVRLQVHVKDEDGNPVDENGAEAVILRETHPMRQVEPGVYEVEYTFERFGHNEMYFALGDSSANFGVDVEVPEATDHYSLVALAAAVTFPAPGILDAAFDTPLAIPATPAISLSSFSL